MLLSDISFVLGLFVKIFSIYYVVIAVFVLIKPKKRSEYLPETRFAVLIPARNEEKVIGQLIESLKRQNYPDDLYDIFVVANNCTDDTSGEALLHGAKVFECFGTVKCKGDALRQSLEYIGNPSLGYDAFCVFDADNIVDKQFLAEMNNAFMSGARVAKGRNEAKNPYDTWISGCYAIYFRMANIVYNRARSNIGLSARLVGTGFAVHRSVIEEMGGWNTTTLTEDAEFAAQCAERGIRVEWVPKAVAYDEEPNAFSVSLKQRKRWCSGLVQVAKLKLPRLLRSLRSGNRGLKADSIMFQLNPFAQAAAFIPAVINIFFMLLPLTSSLEFTTLILFALGAYGGGVLTATAVAVITGGWDRRIIKSILTYPIFLASWLPLQVLAVLHKTTEWEQIHHDRRVPIGEVA